jgi:selenocysteine lyase/cysteine desulfurase
MIGADKKEARLRFLKDYWTSRVKDNTKIMLNTPLDATRSCGIANVGIKGMTPGTLAKRLLDEHKVYTVPIDYANVQGCRITPNVYTTTDELDQFVKALHVLSE